MHFVDEIAAGSFEMNLVTLKLANGRGETYQGQGHLTWTRKDGAHVQALTDGAGFLLQQSIFGKQPCLKGQLIPPDYYLRLDGTNQGGDTITIGRISPGDSEVHFGHPSVAWRIQPSSIMGPIWISGDFPTAGRPAASEMLFSPGLDLWARTSTTTYDNPHFGTVSGSCDWLEADCTFGTIFGNKLDNNDALVRVEFKKEAPSNIAIAIGLAFSFVSGRTNNVFASEMFNDGRVVRMLQDPSRFGEPGRFPAPLAPDLRFSRFREPLLAKATDFYLTDTGRKAGNLLFMCQSVGRSPFTIQALVSSVALESLLKLFGRGESTSTSISDEQTLKILSCVREVGCDERLAARVEGLLNRPDEPSAKNILHEWALRGVLDVAVDDVQAWSRLRNRTAHGRVLWTSSMAMPAKQSELNRLRRVQNLINKLFLNAMQYEGEYFDYVACEPRPLRLTTYRGPDRDGRTFCEI